MVIFSAGDYHKKVLPASQLHIKEDIGAHYTRAQLISNGFCTTKKCSVKYCILFRNFLKPAWQNARFTLFITSLFMEAFTSFYCHGSQSHNGDWKMNDDSVLPDRGLTWWTASLHCPEEVKLIIFWWHRVKVTLTLTINGSKVTWFWYPILV